MKQMSISKMRKLVDLLAEYKAALEERRYIHLASQTAHVLELVKDDVRDLEATGKLSRK